jgi:hypothetical protein
MSDPKTKVTREELHQMVWQQPFVRLAEASIEVSEASGTQAAAPTPRTKSEDRRATSEPPPTFSPVPITRDELYQKVWKSTLGKLVAELGTAHAELVRACEELNVPRPDQSYWSRLRLNLSVAVPPLPEPTPTMALECLLRRKGAPGLRPAERTEAPPTKRAEKVPLPKPPTIPNVPKPKVVEFTARRYPFSCGAEPHQRIISRSTPTPAPQLPRLYSKRR